MTGSPLPGARPEAPASEATLSLDHVGVRFGGVAALEDVSFRVAPGEFVSMIGPNGAGKSTAFNAICGLAPMSHGQVRFGETDLRSLPRHRLIAAGIARTYQGLHVFPSLTVGENLVLGYYSATTAGVISHALQLPRMRRERDAAAERAHWAADEFGLQAVWDRSVAELPYGTQKKVDIARALVSVPRLLLLDEPVAGLPHQDLEELTELISSLSTRFAMSVLLVEHHMSMVMAVSDRIVVLHHGRLIADGTPTEIRRHPDVLEAYLGRDRRRNNA